MISILPSAQIRRIAAIGFLVQLIAVGYCAGQPKAHAASLFTAIRSGSIDQLRKEIANGADVNDTLDGYSALMAATLCGSTDQVRELLDHGANVNALCSDSIPALWFAVPDVEKTKLLLEHGADPNFKVQGYGVLVKAAAIPGTLDIFKLVREHGGDLKSMSTDNYLLYNAAATGDTALVGYLLQSGFNVNDSISFGDYPIINAVQFRTFETVKMLVEKGAKVDARHNVPLGLKAFNGFTALMFAAVSNDKPSILYLLDHGADPNARCTEGYTPLMLYEQAEEDDPQITMAFISHGAKPDNVAIDGTDALYYAKQKGRTASVKILETYVNVSHQ